MASPPRPVAHRWDDARNDDKRSEELTTGDAARMVSAAASTNTDTRHQTEMLTRPENLKRLVRLNARWVRQVLPRMEFVWYLDAWQLALRLP